VVARVRPRRSARQGCGLNRSWPTHRPRPLRPSSQLEGSSGHAASSGGLETDPGLGGQGCDPLGPQHRRRSPSLLGSRRAATTGTPSATTLPQGTWVPWTARIGTTTTSGSVRDLGGLVSLKRHRPYGRGERVAAMPQPPRLVELEAAAILLGVDHEHLTRADHQVIGCWPGDAGGPGRAGPPTPAAPAQPGGGRCVAPPLLPAARRRRPGGPVARRCQAWRAIPRARVLPVPARPTTTATPWPPWHRSRTIAAIAHGLVGSHGGVLARPASGRGNQRRLEER
jgi:hypothetical protein